MEPDLARRAVAAAMSTASDQDLEVNGAEVLSDSNRLVVRLSPCQAVARIAVAPAEYRSRLEKEAEIASRLAPTGSPIAGLDPRVEPRLFERDGFAITMWTYFEPVSAVLPAAEYAQLLEHLHIGLRQIDVSAPHFMDRVRSTQQDVANPGMTPDLSESDRSLLTNTLADLSVRILQRNPAEQLLHGEPHPWNILQTKTGPLFVDFENSAVGPVELDLAWAPKEVGDRYAGVDQGLVDECRGLVLAIIAMHRWRLDDRHPSGRESGVAFLDAVRKGPPWQPPDTVTW